MASNNDERTQKHYVHPETIAFYKARTEDGAQPYFEMGVEKARQDSLATAAKYGMPIDLEGTEREVVIPSPYDADGIALTIYNPTACDSEASPIILIYFHGGADVLCCRKTHESVCKILARDTPSIVVNVEYRLAPEHRFPANIDDAKVVIEWVSANKAAVGGSSGSKLGVSGDSAGGKMAAIVCHEATKLIDFAVIVYPTVSMQFEHLSLQENSTSPQSLWKVIEWFSNNYIDEKDKSSPRASVILNKDFSYLPPTMIIVGDLDTLRDSCYAYYDKLKKAGVKVEMVTVKGVPHGFWSYTGSFKETGKEAHDAATTFIRKFRS